MHRTRLAATAGLSAIASLLLGATQQPDRAVAFTNVAVVDVAAGTVRRDQTVVVVGQRISLVGPTRDTRPPANARVVNAAGQYMIPGMWDMHAHLAMAGRPALDVLLANGVTGVRDMGGGLSRVREWRDSARAGMIAGPRIRMAGPIFESARWRESVIGLFRRDGHEDGAQSIIERIGVATPDDAIRAVDSVITLGGEFVKVRTGSNAATFYAILRAARARGLPVVGHAPTQVPLAAISDSGMASVEHSFFGVIDGRGGMELDSVPPAERRAIFGRFARNRTAVTPTLIAGKGYRHTPNDVVLAIVADSLGRIEPRRRHVSRALADHWRGQIDLKRYEGPLDWDANRRSKLRDLRELRAAGVPILAGTDLGAPLVYPGFALHDELDLLVREAGLTPAQALRAATLTPAEFFGATDSLGTVAPGKLADLVLLRANPLDNIRNVATIQSVVANGRVFSREELDGLLSTGQPKATPRNR